MAGYSKESGSRYENDMQSRSSDFVSPYASLSLSEERFISLTFRCFVLKLEASAKVFRKKDRFLMNNTNYLEGYVVP